MYKINAFKTNVLIIFSIIVYANIQLMRWIKRGLFKGFEEVKDLVRGTIVAEVDQLWEAYEHFRDLEGVEIIEIKSLKKVDILQNITILFVYK